MISVIKVHIGRILESRKVNRTQKILHLQYYILYKQINYKRQHYELIL